MKYLKNLIEITLGCKNLNHKANIIGDSECKAMFSSVKHLENLKKLYLQSKKKDKSTDCELSPKSSIKMEASLKYLTNLREINLYSKKDQIQIVNQIGDAGCKSLFRSAMYLENLEMINLDCISNEK